MPFQKVGNVLHGDTARPVTPKEYRIAPESAEYNARVERLLQASVNVAVVAEDGQIIYRCKACRDMGWLRADVPFNHPLFGKVRLCPCSHQFSSFGARWFAPSELYHQ